MKKQGAYNKSQTGKSPFFCNSIFSSQPYEAYAEEDPITQSHSQVSCK